MNLQIKPIPALKDNYIWAIIESELQAALIVDPGEAAPVLDFLNKEKLTLKGILITHHHFDHTNGVAELKSYYDCPVFGSAAESVAEVTVPVRGGDKINIAHFPLTLTVIDIPGHTSGHIAYYAKEMLFCGDTLFSAGCGRLFEGTPGEMYASLQKIAELPNDTKIYCGHEYTLNNLKFAKTVEPHNINMIERIQAVESLREKNQPTLPSLLSQEKETNPFLRCDSAELIEQVALYAKQKLHHPVEVFKWLRKWKDEF